MTASLGAASMICRVIRVLRTTRASQSPITARMPSTILRLRIDQLRLFGQHRLAGLMDVFDYQNLVHENPS